MTKNQWEAFCDYKNQLKKHCDEWLKFSDELKLLQTAASKVKNDTPEYPIETPVVYNTAYDDFTEADEINLIVVGDNPGKNEQLEKNRKYLVGQSGKIAAGFFAGYPELKTDFRKNVIIANKTPVHTAKTNHLKYLMKNGSPEIQKLILDSQKIMAEMTAALHQKLIAEKGDKSVPPQLWLVGYAELKDRGIFLPYRDCLKSAYKNPGDWDNVFVYQHFSMNRFSIDLKDFRQKNPQLDLAGALKNLGHQHRDEIFGGPLEK